MDMDILSYYRYTYSGVEHGLDGSELRAQRLRLTLAEQQHLRDRDCEGADEMHMHIMY